MSSSCKNYEEVEPYTDGGGNTSSSSCKNYEEVEPYTDGGGNTSYSGTGSSDHVCRPVLLDGEDKKHPIIGYSSGYNAERDVMKAKCVVEHNVPFFRRWSDIPYRTDEPLVDLKRHAQPDPAYNRPEKVEDFFIEVQNEVSNPHSRGSAPSSSNWRARPNSTGKDGSGTGNTNLHGDDNSGNRDKQSEVYPQLTKVTNPIIENKEMYYKRPTVRNHPLGNTLDRIGREAFSLVDEPFGRNFETFIRKKIDKHPMPTNPLNNKEGSQKANGNRSATLYSAPSQQQQRFYSKKDLHSLDLVDFVDINQSRHYSQLKNNNVAPLCPQGPQLCWWTESM